MKKNKSTIGKNIITGFIVILALIVLCVIATWVVDGVMDVAKTYNQVYLVENDIDEIYYYHTGKTITNRASTITQFSKCLPIVGCRKATLIK